MSILNRNRTHPLSLDGYKTFLGEERQLHKPLSFYEYNIVGYIATLIFVAIDFVCLYTVWNTVQTESSTLVRLLAVGCAICLDVPMAIAALALKRYFQKLLNKKQAMIIAIASVSVFFIAFVFSLCFRVVTKDLTFEVGGASTMTNSVSGAVFVNDESKNTILIAALFNGVIPLCTSIASFVITFFASDPLKEILFKLERKHISLISRKTEVAIVLEEAKRVKKYVRFLLGRENDMFNQYKDECFSQGNMEKQATGIAIIEQLSTPDDVTIVTERRAKLNTEFEDKSEPYNDAAAVVYENAEEEHENTKEEEAA